MTAARFSAFAFNHPDMDAGAPGLVIRPGGRVEMVEGVGEQPGRRP